VIVIWCAGIMRIGLIAPPWVPVPPPGYGGTELVVDNLARGLQALGHDVCLFTVGESTSPVRREYLYPTAVEPIGLEVPAAAHVLAAYEALQDMDVIHDHTMLGSLVAGQRRRRHPPVLTTNHGPFTDPIRRIFAEAARHASIVAISHAQARTAVDIPITAVIHHGIDLDIHRPGPGDGGYLLFVGRMSPDKGAHRAVRVAGHAGRRLLMVTKMREPDEQAYYEQMVRPLLGPDAEPPVELPLARRLQMFGGAAALLNPIRWPEPFGLVMAESLAAGTPVLAFPNGSAPEIVDHGRTGFLCADEDEMAEAVGRVGTIDRAACRSAAERRFSMQRMAREHERLYRQVLEGAPPIMVRQEAPRRAADA